MKDVLFADARETSFVRPYRGHRSTFWPRECVARIRPGADADEPTPFPSMPTDHAGAPPTPERDAAKRQRRSRPDG